jgi:hypothetical protein
MTVMEQLAQLEKQFTPEQAKVILDVIEKQTVTREYLKGELQELRNQLFFSMLAVAGVSLTIAKLIGA